MIISFDEEKHVYTEEGTKENVPSVTKILGAVYGTGLENAPKFFVERAAGKGKIHHTEFDTYLRTGKQGETPEFKTWWKWFNFSNGAWGNCESEKIIFAATPYGPFAGTLDFFAHGFIYDWKTSKTATRAQIKKWQMQLSFYAYAMRQMGEIVNEPLKIVHVTAEECKVINVDYLGDKFVEDTMKLYKEGQPVEAAPAQELMTVSKAELMTLEDILIQIDSLEKAADTYRERIKAEMEQRGILDLRVGQVKMTYIAGTTRKSFDSTKFKKEHADLYKQYQKDVEVGPSVRITINGK